jgi:hypothetical protein
MIVARSVSFAPAGYRFLREVIAMAVRWYLRYGLSYRDIEELLASVASASITSPCTGGCRRSRRSSSMPRDPPGMLLVTGGSWTRPTLRSPVAGATCTARSTSTARWSMSSFPCAATRPRHGSSSLARCGTAGCRSKSRPTVLPPTRR